jgi:hypothetical protein
MTRRNGRETVIDVQALLLSLMEPTRQEPGCLRYELLHDQRGKAFIQALLHCAQGGFHYAHGGGRREFQMIADGRQVFQPAP